MSSIFEIKEGIQRQTTNETIIYTVDTGDVGSSPTVGTVIVYDESDNDADVTSTAMPSGAHTDAGDIITLKPLTALTLNHFYRIEIQFASGSSTYEGMMKVKCTR